MKIWMLTWNCENQAPKDRLFDQFCDELLPASEEAHWPDILVIALQEAACYSGRQFVTQKIAERFKKNYALLSSSSLMGTTKFPAKCFIHLGVLVRIEEALTLNPLHGGAFAPLKMSNQGSGEYRDGRFPRCKGGAFAKVNYAGKNLGFIGAHLDGPAKVTACNRQIQKLLQSISNSTDPDPAKISTALNQFDALFFMGDLNYRLSADSKKPMRVNDMVAAIGQTTPRKSLWDYDTLNGKNILLTSPSPLVGPYSFMFPQFDVLPTYKRYYEDRTINNPCLRLSSRMVTTAGDLTPGVKVTATGTLTSGVGNQQQITDNLGMLQACYFQGKTGIAPAESTKRMGFYELGWLDRIGFRIKPGTTIAPNSIMFKALDNIVLSDHTPIVMKITLN
jgi:endonuclease/exonuclease/phosphatase family metal-dependent hydrolase